METGVVDFDAMRTASFHKASAIRQQSRTGRTVAQLAAAFDLDEVDIEKILAFRTIEAAAQVLDAKDSLPTVKRLMLTRQGIVDFTNLIQR